jgi:GNAT superfamily N-acetyltransferase
MNPPLADLFQAWKPHLEPVAVLFDLYRQFYGQAPDLAGARQFIGERMEKGESVIFLAAVEKEPVGFFQLYPSFTSAWMRRTWIFNDLYVREDHRKKGIGRLLMEKAVQFGGETGAKRLTLSTAKDNLPAQALYESMGWKRESVFWSYTFELP